MKVVVMEILRPQKLKVLAAYIKRAGHDLTMSSTEFNQQNEKLLWTTYRQH